jgi:mRNA (guanine-N7-)-methyltransferase
MLTEEIELRDLFQSARQEANAELEIRLQLPNPVYKDRAAFQRVLSKFKGITKDPKSLDIVNTNSKDEKYRIRLTGDDALKAFQEQVPLDKIVSDAGTNAESIKKLVLKRVPIRDYNMSVVLSKEDRTSVDRISRESALSYRYKQRYSIFDEPLRYDFTVVKTGLNEMHFEYEIEIFLASETDDNDEKMIELIMEKSHQLLGYIYNQEDMLPIYQQKQVFSEYMNLIGGITPTFVGPQPVTFEHKHVTQVGENYSATIKADGERRLLFFNRRGVPYLINQKFQVERLKGGEYLEAAESLFDVEKMSGHKLMVFDTYFFAKKPFHTDHDLSTRLLAAKRLEKITEGLVEIKVFETADKNGINRIMNMLKINNIPSDGVIFTPWDDGLPLKKDFSKKWDRLLKWKPPSHNSMDFKLHYHDTITRDFKNYKRYKLMCGSRMQEFENMLDYLENSTGNRNYGLKAFEPETMHPFPVLPQEDTSLVWVEESLPSLHGKIMECIFKDTKWITLKERIDKTEPNDIGSVMSSWITTMRPIPLEKIRDQEKTNNDQKDMQIQDDVEDIYYYRHNNDGFKGNLIKSLTTFHNKFVKRSALIYKFKGKVKSVLDIACGQGGDIFKYVKIGATDMIGIDVTAHNLYNKEEGAIKRLSENKIPRDYRYVFLKMDGGLPINEQIDQDPEKDLKKILWGTGDKRNLSYKMQRYYKMMQPKSFDLISCQFAIHYFFQNKTTLLNFVNNVDQMLAPGGYFIGTCLDAIKIDSMFQKKTKYEGFIGPERVWSMEKKYKKSFNNSHSVGYKLEFNIASIGKELSEYMVSFDLLVAYMASKNIHLLTPEQENELGMKGQQSFEEIFNNLKKNSTGNQTWAAQEALSMTPAEKELSFLYKYFVFTRNV